MKTSRLSGKLTASVMSAVMAVSAVPAYMLSAPVYAEYVPSISVSANKGAVASIKVGGVSRLYTADYAKSTDKYINITFTPDFTGNFNYGFGIGTAKAPYWYELDGKTGKFIDTSGTAKASGTDVACTAGKPVTISIDISSLDVKFDPSTSQYPGEFELRNYYAGETKSTVSITSITGSATPGGSSSSDDKPAEGSVSNKNRHSNGENCDGGKNWSFKDNRDGTATITATIAKQVDPDVVEDLVLTKGYDEDYYAENPDEVSATAPINSHKFKYSDFGITDSTGITIESLTVTLEPSVEMDQFIFGGGLNVEYKSDADTEYAKQLAGIEGKEHSGYWYNDMGEDAVAEFEKDGVEFAVTPGTGGKITGAGKYIEAYWEVPAGVQPYVTTKPADSISFQYWWGNDTKGDEVDSVTVTDAVLTYTQEITIPYTGSSATPVKETLDHTGKDTEKNLEIAYSDLDIDDTKNVYAVRFDISSKSDIGKFIYGLGTGVKETVSSDYWYQENGNFAILDTGKKNSVMWILPDTVSGGLTGKNGINTANGKLQLGYYYGEQDTISIDNIEVYYAEAPQTTTTTEVTTTTTMTTTTAAPQATLWGDADNNKSVTVSDIVMVLQYSANKKKYPITDPIGLANADCNGDSDVNAKDAYIIQQLDAGVITQKDCPVKD